MNRLDKDIDFILEIDKMKFILRMTSPLKSERREDDAQHSWHVAISALVLEEYADEEVDISRVINMLLVHDLVEVYAGDTFCYDVEGNEDKREREVRAADKIFGILDDDKKERFRGLWDEFEEGETPEAKFANALDRFQPILLNYNNGGGTWKKYNIKRDAVYERMAPIEDISAKLWDYTCDIIEDGVEKGWIEK